MSKTSKQSYTPSASTYVNGNLKSSVATGKNGTVSQYNMSPYEKQSYEYAIEQFAKNLQNVNVFSPETLNGLNLQVDAYKNRALDALNSTYQPMIKNMQNDVAKRFGNLDNSIFMDNLKGIESSRANAMSLLAQDVTAKQQELMNNELANRYEFLSYLNNYQNQVNNNIYQALGYDSSAANANMNYLTEPYAAQNRTSSNGAGELFGDVFGAVGALGDAKTRATAALVGNLFKKYL